VYGLTLFGNPQVVEIEKVLHSSRSQLTDVATVRGRARDQRAEVTLVKIDNAFDVKPPIEQYRRRLGHEKQSGAPENQEGQKSNRHPQSVPREIRLRGYLAEQGDYACREEERTKSSESRVG
jgi:hypothetical protein